MQPVDLDLNFIENTCHDLNDYVLSDLLYWPVDYEPINSGTTPSRTTIGLLRLVVEQVRLRNLNEDQTERLEICQLTIDKVHRKWKVAWEKKVVGEFKSRVRTWHAYISEAESDRQLLHTNYRSQVQNRTILQLLLTDLPVDETALVLALHKIDEWLKTNLSEGPFIWDPELQSAFPEEKYWFLYRNLEG
jgi:hypothetical protein